MRGCRLASKRKLEQSARVDVAVADHVLDSSAIRIKIIITVVVLVVIVGFSSLRRLLLLLMLPKPRRDERPQRGEPLGACHAHDDEVRGQTVGSVSSGYVGDSQMLRAARHVIHLSL